MERSLVLIKPDGVERRLVGEIIGRFESKGLKIVGLKFGRLPLDQVERHYEDHRGKPFYPSLVEFMSGGPVVAMVLEGAPVMAVVANVIFVPATPLEASSVRVPLISTPLSNPVIVMASAKISPFRVTKPFTPVAVTVSAVSSCPSVTTPTASNDTVPVPAVITSALSPAASVIAVPPVVKFWLVVVIVMVSLVPVN